jgi:uncharacterized Zn finger protein
MSALPPSSQPPNPSQPPKPATPAPYSSGPYRPGQNNSATRFDKRVTRPTLHPRRVVGGYRLQNRPPTVVAGETAIVTPEGEHPAPTAWTWISARWMRPVEQLAPGDQLAEGLEYAKAGQTRSIEIKPGIISGRVQGRMPQAYRTSVRMPTFTPEQWEKVTAAMSGQAKYAAALLAGELPTNIEDLFAPAGLNLFPTGNADLSCSCECDVFTGKPHDYGPGDPSAPPPPPKPKSTRGGLPWCKHVCCLMYLVADKLGPNPLTIFMLRGMPEQDLVERLRQARVLQGLQRSGSGAIPVYTAHVPGVGRVTAPLEESLANFWTADDPDALASLDMPIAPPEVSHPLLRRVGPSPFTGAKFPITGLLATCYDVISASVIQASEHPASPADAANPTGSDSEGEDPDA